MAITNYRPTIWHAALLENLHQNTFVIPTLNRDYEGDIVNGGETVKITGFSSVTVGTYAGSITRQALTDSTQSLAIDQKNYYAYLVDDVDKVQSAGSFDQVMIDNFSASRDAVDHLIAQGRTRIAAIGAQRNCQSSSTIRLAAYEHSLTDAGIAVDPSLIGYVDAFRRRDGAAAMERLLELPERPDAIFCFSDPIALGAMRVLHQNNIRMPQDIAVVGFDDIEDGHYSTPSLSSISPDKRFIAAKALELLSARLEGSNLPPAPYLAPYKLIVRGSSSETVA